MKRVWVQGRFRRRREKGVAEERRGEERRGQYVKSVRRDDDEVVEFN